MLGRAHPRLLVCVPATKLVRRERGCSAVPTAPSPAPVAATPTLISFAGPDTESSTAERHDVQEQVLQLNMARELTWTADRTHLSEDRVDRSAYPGISVIYANVTGDKQNDIEVVRC